MNAPLRDIPAKGHHASEDLLNLSLMREPLERGLPALQLLAAIRQYYQMRDFSHQERFGVPEQLSMQAFSGLDQAQQVIKALAGASGDEEVEVEVSFKVRRPSEPLE